MPATQLAITSSEADPVELDPRLWISASQAAEAMGLHRDNLTRRCRSMMSKQGLAVFAATPGPGAMTPQWWIKRKYDRRLAPGRIGEDERTPTLDHLGQEQQQAAYARLACVRRYTEARQTWKENQAVWLPRLVNELRTEHPGLTISERSIQRWYRLFDGKPANLAKLADTRGGNQRGEPDPAAWDFFRTTFLQQRTWTLTECWRRVRGEAKAQGWRWCSLAACRRWVKAKLTRDEETLARDPRTWRSVFRPFLEQDPEGFAAGECWIGDHCQLDLICAVATPRGVEYVRPWLTAWMDWRTRRIMGWHLSTNPNSSTILAALRSGLLDPQLITMPSHVWIDNGKDYDCWLFHGQTKRQRQMMRGTPGAFRSQVDQPTTEGLLAQLGIEAHFSIPHNPNGKSRLELWFNYGLHQTFDKMKPTYCGFSDATRPEYLNKLLTDRAVIPTFDEILAGIELHIEGYNASDEHQKTDMAGLSPDAYLLRHVKVRRLPLDPAALDGMLTKHHRPVTMGKNGIALMIAGKVYKFGQFKHELTRFKAATKAERPMLRVMYDPADLSSIRVFDERLRFICNAPANELYGCHSGDKISEEHLKEGHRQKRHAIQSQREHYRNARLTYASTFEIAAQLARDERRAKAKAGGPPGPNPDAPLVPVQTPLDGQDLQAMQPVRKAAGAERSAPLPSWSDKVFAQQPKTRRFTPPTFGSDDMSRLAFGGAVVNEARESGRPLPSPSELLKDFSYDSLSDMPNYDDSEELTSPWATNPFDANDETEAHDE